MLSSGGVGMKTLYERLGITPQASSRAIQQSFFRLAKKFDPNIPANRDNAEIRTEYQAIHDAYRTLSDPDTRRKYDSTLQKPSLIQRVKAQRSAQLRSGATENQ